MRRTRGRCGVARRCRMRLLPWSNELVLDAEQWEQWCAMFQVVHSICQTSSRKRRNKRR